MRYELYVHSSKPKEKVPLGFPSPGVTTSSVGGAVDSACVPHNAVTIIPGLFEKLYLTPHTLLLHFIIVEEHYFYQSHSSTTYFDALL